MRRIAFLVLAGVLLVTGLQVLLTILDARNAQADHPRPGEYVTVGGVRLHYVQSGGAGERVEAGRQTVVLLHGNPGFVQDWSAVIPLLADRYHVIAFDRPGHGYSRRASGAATTPSEQARLLRGALQQLGVERPILVGHSWGGALALIYTLQYPDDVSGIVLFGPRAFPLESGESLVYRLVRTPLAGDLFRYTIMAPVARRILDRGIAAAYRPERPNAEQVAAARALWLRPGQVKATVWDTWSLKEELQTFSLWYQEIRVPTLIVVGEHDRPERESVPLARTIPGAQLEIIPGAGHMLHITRPELVVEMIDRVSPRSAGAGITLAIMTQ